MHRELYILGLIDFIAVMAASERDTYQPNHPTWHPPSETIWADSMPRGALSRRAAQPARIAELELRYGPESFNLPRNLLESPLALWVLYLRDAPPPTGFNGVDWLLLTKIATSVLAAAQDRVRWYGARWAIVVFHRTRKTGCQIEERQLGFVIRLENCLAIDLVVAWRI